MRNNKEEKRHTAAGKMTNSERDFKGKLNDLQIWDISLPVVSIGKVESIYCSLDYKSHYFAGKVRSSYVWLKLK